MKFLFCLFFRNYTKSFFAMFLKNLQKTSVKLCSFRRLSKFPLGSQIFDNERPKNSIFYGYRLDSELKTVQDLNNPVVSTAGNDLLAGFRIF